MTFSLSAVPAKQRHRRSRRLNVSGTLVSVAGLIRRPVLNPSGVDVGRVADVVIGLDDSRYPPVTGLLARVGRRQVWVPLDKVQTLARDRVVLRSATLDLADFRARPGEVVLGRDVLDHQLVDTDGVRVVRASDLYLADLAGSWRLVGVDVGLRTLARRLGPTRWRDRPTPDRVIDWAGVQPFGGPPGQLRLAASRRELHRLRPGELADLLEQLGRAERQELLDSVDPRTAADALEEMRPEELDALLRESTPERVAQFVASMEPDEAADALRQLDAEERREVLRMLPADTALTLDALARYPAATAGGCMTTRVLAFRPSDTVADVVQRLRAERDHRAEIDSVVVVDNDGHLIDDITLFELLVADPDQHLDQLIGEPWPVTVTAEQDLPDVVDALVDARASSLLVVDEDNRPLGRILADDLIDALIPDRGRLRFPRLIG